MMEYVYDQYCDSYSMEDTLDFLEDEIDLPREEIKDMIQHTIDYNKEQFIKDYNSLVEGFKSKFNFTEIYANRNTPICFPKKRPHTIPKGTGFSNALKLIPSNDTPAFANANKGIMPNATYFEMPCSSFSRRDFDEFFLSCGMSNANKTPDIVACMPELCVKYHSKIPINR